MRATCGICGKRSGDELPPEVQPCVFRNATEDYSIDLCSEHRTTATLGQVMDAAEGTPGGTVKGADRIPYMVHATA